MPAGVQHHPAGIGEAHSASVLRLELGGFVLESDFISCTLPPLRGESCPRREAVGSEGRMPFSPGPRTRWPFSRGRRALCSASGLAQAL